ncbi:hypothetical protein DFH07DRAFT_746472, partial [Mycena maculata]
STRNTRIERLWVEVGSQFARRWRGFFLRLERLHRFDPDDPHHLWLLHHLFLDDINEDCKEFQNQWNHHPISGKGENQTPADMRFVGELLYGKYGDDFENVHPDILQRYGQEGNHLDYSRKYNSGTLKGDLDLAIAGDQDHHIRHEAIEVMENKLPFANEEAEQIFADTLREAHNEGIIPDGLGVAEGEWEDGVYSEIEIIKVGRKDVPIALPFTVWWPRAVKWAQGLELMVKIRAVESGDIDMI